jgi:hypothetical protein
MALKLMVNRPREFDARVGILNALDIMRLNMILDEPIEPFFGAAGLFSEGNHSAPGSANFVPDRSAS